MAVNKKSENRIYSTLEILTVYVSSFMFLLNLMLSLTIFPLYVQYRGGSDFIIGLQTGIFTLASVVLRLYFGPLADSVGRKIPLILGSFVFATVPIMVWLSPNFLIMSLARLYQAIGMATFLSAAGSAISEMVPVKKRSVAIGFYRAIAVSPFLIGPYIGFI